MILTVLKIIGIIVLILLSILILLIILLLFAPIHYSLKANSDGTVIAKGQANWLFHIANARFSFVDKDFHFKVKILWFTILSSSPKKARKSKEPKENLNNNEKDFKELDSEDSNDIKDTIKLSDLNSKESNNSIKNANTFKEKNTSKKKKKFGKLKTFVENIKQVKTKISYYKKVFNDQRNKKAIELIKNQLIKLLKKICPRKFSLNAKFSAKSPDITAYIYGILSLFPIGYQNRWIIEPDFESDELYVKGTCNVKGSIQLIYIIKAFIDIYFNKYCKRFFQQLKA